MHSDGWAGGARVPPILGGSVNPIPTTRGWGAYYAHHISTGTSKFCDLPPCLQSTYQYSVIPLLVFLDDTLVSASRTTDARWGNRLYCMPHGQKFTPKFLGTAKVYFVCHIGPIFQIYLCLHWVSVVRGRPHDDHSFCHGSVFSLSSIWEPEFSLGKLTLFFLQNKNNYD